MGRPALFQGEAASYNPAIVIHQIQIKYDALADRLLMQVRTRNAEVYALWLTRRMMLRLWPAFQRLNGVQSLARASPGAVVLPEARAMLAEVARQRPLPNADFSQPFQAETTHQPLGEQPLLAAEIEMQAHPQRGLLLTVREAEGRQVSLQFDADLQLALLRLFEQALAAADWTMPGAEVAPAAPPPLLS